jgi:PAS domain-containing protein
VTDRTNPVQYWARELGRLRGCVVRLRGRVAEPNDDLTEAALAAADSLLRELAGAQLECERLRASSRAQTAEWERLFGAAPCAWVITDRAGTIRDANGMASVLLNVSVKHLKGRQLLVHTENRKVFSDLLAGLNSGAGPDDAVLKMRPRDRRPIEMNVTVMPAPPNESGDWLWYFAGRQSASDLLAPEIARNQNAHERRVLMSASATCNGGCAVQPDTTPARSLSLPEGSGFDVCSQIKTTRPDLPVVLSNAVYRSAHARRGGFGAGADAYVVDPTPPARLVNLTQALTAPEQAPADRPRAVLVTTPHGNIVSADERAAALLNVGIRALRGRDLLTFFNGDRARLRAETAAAAAGQVCDVDASLRPRDRKPVNVRVDLAASLDGGPGELEWTIEA